MHTLEYLVLILQVLFTNELRAAGQSCAQFLKINFSIKYRERFKTSNLIF